MKTKDFTCVDFGSTSLVKYKNGLSLVTPMEQLRRWINHFRSILNKDEPKQLLPDIGRHNHQPQLGKMSKNMTRNWGIVCENSVTFLLINEGNIQPVQSKYRYFKITIRDVSWVFPFLLRVLSCSFRDFTADQKLCSTCKGPIVYVYISTILNVSMSVWVAF